MSLQYNMRQMVCEIIDLLQEILLPSEEMHRSDQKQPIRAWGAVNHPHVHTVKHTNSGGTSSWKTVYHHQWLC